MNNQSIRWRLAGAILILSFIPLVASYFLVSEVLDSVISLHTDSNAGEIFKEYQADLKKLKILDDKNSHLYKQKFYQLEEKLLIHEEPAVLKGILRGAFLTYYLVLIVFIMLFSCLVAVVLSRSVARSYKKLSMDDLQKSKKLQTLQYFDEWQEIARKLAHEIKNPLTPIEMSMGNLLRNHGVVSEQDYQGQLQDTYQVVNEEVKKLRDMVNHFTQFSKLPEPEFESLNIIEYLERYIHENSSFRPKLLITLYCSEAMTNICVRLDVRLFSQCLANVLGNAEEANPRLTEIIVNISVNTSVNTLVPGNVVLTIHNEGKAIDAGERDKLFNMYYTTKPAGENMGLGLPIVKKILLDHGGDIENVPSEDGATFSITLPVAGENQ
ncbi:MAG: hypothetical protein COA42_14560 [Alteromonadaceae bacterium]|nr:MAG: hypothetical protein COA42_14560 [Alteromonadaceae bacterium]